MQINGIDYKKCNDCELCIKVCPVSLYSIDENKSEDKVVYNDPIKRCVRCGHCIAICPEEAIKYKEADEPYSFENASNIEEIVSYNDLLKAIRIRRSMRVYKDEPIPKEQIERILEAMRYAPSASNRQGWRYLVITNKSEIKYLESETMKFFKMSRRLLPFKYFVSPFVSKAVRRRIRNPKVKLHLDESLASWKAGKDIIFFDAPCVIILYSRVYANKIEANDAGIALTHGMLTAQALGYGTCWIGLAQRRLQNKKKLRKHYKIPKGFQVMGVMTIGKPAVKYQRCPPRRPLRVRWIE
ncbi:MAG: 4Fe-4S dicluster domain-containing protein [Asgard group archaeon]|nr:4Fe-4S dicluster domain-containing protein [Asgard group archaeon]